MEDSIFRRCNDKHLFWSLLALRHEMSEGLDYQVTCWKTITGLSTSLPGLKIDSLSRILECYTKDHRVSVPLHVRYENASVLSEVIRRVSSHLANCQSVSFQ